MVTPRTCDWEASRFMPWRDQLLQISPSPGVLLKRKLARRQAVTCPRSEGSVVTKPGLALRSADSQPSALSTTPVPLIVAVCETPALLSRVQASPRNSVIKHQWGRSIGFC